MVNELGNIVRRDIRSKFHIKDLALALNANRQSIIKGYARMGMKTLRVLERQVRPPEGARDAAGKLKMAQKAR